jgi:hypothetical protein
MKENAGRIDLPLAKRFEADHFDAYKGRTRPGGRSLCRHLDLDEDGEGRHCPFDCDGTVDGKVVDARQVRQMAFDARWGAACGRAFRADKFLAAHPQFDWLAPILLDRPSQPWVTFRAGE